MPLKAITVLLVEDHTIVREGLRALLKLETGIQIVGEAENGRQAVALTRKLRPAVVVMDVAMPLLNGMEATRQILAAHPKTKILILSAHSDDAYVERALALGASGYLVKQTSAHILGEAIRKVWLGMRFFSPTISRRLDHEQLQERGKAEGKKDPARLTPREMEVLQLIAEGKANKQTAVELHISIKTVEKHRQSMMNKLDIHDTAGLTRHAIAVGIIESSVQGTIAPPADSPRR
ncbi:response regulator transcription factor [Haloferula sp. BvORR071]|uniref:response regulator n=1 Tax=Haloferula sp. BvORR071 TaxID=1396141 RepID=UPI0005526D18|nr:response regulator transcription factor [Haloferula sp. BvORR071]